MLRIGSAYSHGRATRLASLVVLLTLTLYSATNAQEPDPAQVAKPSSSSAPDKLTSSQRAKNVQAFDLIWTTIRDKHFDPKLGGLDWQGIRDKLRPRVEQAATMKDARAIMNEAIEQLHQTHFGIIPVDVYKDLESPHGGPGEVGVDLRIVDGHAVVTAVTEGQPASAAGVKTGWIVEKIDGKPVSQILQAAEVAYAKSGMLAARKALAVAARLHGPIGSTIALDFIDQNENPVHLAVKAVDPKGVPATFGNLPTFYVRFTAKRIDRTVGYVSLNIFFDLVNVLKQYGEAIEASRDAEGLIIDLRGNPGGMGAMSFAMGGWLVSERGLKLGTLVTRDGSLNFTLFPRPRPFTAPVAVLVDELSMSTSEILAGGLRDLKRARVFGVRTPGAALPSTIEVLPNGDRFQYAFANYISANGQPLEGIGVVPDVETPWTRVALFEGRDPAVEAALGWIRSSKKIP
jgi:carboxyl-terminal processing protease